MLGLVYFGTLKTVTLILWIVALWLGRRWIKATTISWWKIIVTGLLIVVGFQVLAGLMMPKMVAAGLPTIAGWGVIAFLYVVGTIFVVAIFFQIHGKNVVLASLPTFAALIGMLLVITFVLKPFFVDAYRIPTMSMGPTLLGNHIRATCPECGATRYGSAWTDYISDEFFEDMDMICDNFHISQGCPWTDEAYSGDHILVSKLATPKRWDLLVFRFPHYPEHVYVMRLIGMPGETIQIEDGAVYADGQLLTLPPELEGLQYADHLADNPNPTPLWGSIDRPAKLNDGEYFVLGDFTTNASDSRLWTFRSKQSSGNPYAVPKEYIIGVAAEIYWPYDRWRSFP
ncbi:signal peptidase I [Bremerella sp.]|uniref:signal peptidase I n=1 Tax=Bremerella sp. TaxID=2795602 RepID=UPI00391AE8F6